MVRVTAVIDRRFWAITHIRVHIWRMTTGAVAHHLTRRSGQSTVDVVGGCLDKEFVDICAILAWGTRRSGTLTRGTMELG